MRCIIYARVSTEDQTVENQLLELKEYASRQNWSIVETITDIASGGKSAEERSGLNRVFTLAHKKKFDVLLFWSLDRLSREGSRTTLEYLTRFDKYGVGYRSYSESYLDSLGPFSDAVIAILSALARQEKIRISERTKAGMARVKASGKAIGRPKTDPAVIDHAKQLRSQGLSFAAIGRELNLSRVRAFELCR